MLNGDGTENAIKINRSNWQKKQIFPCSTLFLLISNKTNLHVHRPFFVFLCRCLARLQCRFVRLKRQASKLHIIFKEELSYVLTKDFVSCVHVRFYFFTTAHLPCWPLASGRKAPCKRTQHCWPPTPNIVGCYMLRPFAHAVACCWMLLRKV